MKIDFIKASKYWGLAILSIISVQSSFAVVADRFSCKMKIVHSASGAESTQNTEFHLARLPLSWSPAPDTRMTSARHIINSELKSNRQIISANLNLNYDHSVKLDGNYSRVIEARQSTCLALAVDFCDLNDSHDGNDLSCGQSLFGCVQGPVESWPLVRFMESGTPLFNEQSLLPEREFVKDRNGIVRGTVDVACQYMGTFE